MTRSLYFVLLLPAVALLLGGCGRSSTDVEVSSQSSSKSHMAENSDRVHIDISYPRLNSSEQVLSKAMHAYADKQKQSVLQAMPDLKKYPELADRQMQLKISWTVSSRMPRLVSVRGQGMADTGGAHPRPIEKSFVFDTRANRIIQLGDLFADTDQARRVLATIARKDLEQKLLKQAPGENEATAAARKEWITNMRDMIAQGTQAEASNFAHFTVLAGAGDKASGIELIFPPYQVAPYVYGTQTVDVGVDAFADLLKPEWRDAFDLQ